jgi:hypothetical protein
VAQLSLPSFETLTKLSGWASEQGIVFLSIITGGPKNYLIGVRSASQDILPKSVKFAAFVVLVSVVITVPIDSAMLKLDVFSPKVIAFNVVGAILCISIFTVGMHFCCRMLRGKGAFGDTLPAMLFSAAYLPFFFLIDYLEYTDPAIVQSMRSEEFSPFTLQMSSVPYFIFVIFIECLFFVYIWIKLTPVVAVVHSFGRFRSSLAVALNGILFLSIYYLTLLPVAAAFVKSGG